MPDTIGFDSPQEEREYHRQQAINAAIDAADQIILEASDGSIEETDYLTVQVALEFLQKVQIRLQGNLLKYDMEQSSKTEPS